MRRLVSDLCASTLRAGRFPQTLNPQSYTRNLKPEHEIRNTKAYTRNPKPESEIRTPKPETREPEPNPQNRKLKTETPMAFSIVASSHESGEREFFIDNLLVRIHFIIEMIRWTGLAPWEFKFPFPGSLASTFQARAGPNQTAPRSWRSAYPGGVPPASSTARYLSFFLARDGLGVGWEGCRESRRCSRDTYSESYITKYTSIRGVPSVDPPSSLFPY